MNVHANAKLTPRGRLQMVLAILEDGLSPSAAASNFGVSPATASKWLRRYQEGGPEALEDASSRPRRQPRRTNQGLRRKVSVLRRRRLTILAIAVQTGLSKATVSRILRQAGLSRLSALEPKDPPRRYQRQHPGELIHLDIKKFGRIQRAGHRIHGDRRRRARGIGWEFLHVCIDDASRLAYAEVLPDERKESAASFLVRALAFLRTHRIKVQRLMDRQRILLPLQALRQDLRGGQDPPHLHQALHPTDQRQGRTLHPECHQGMGLRPLLPALFTSHSPVAKVDTPLQLASPPPRS